MSFRPFWLAWASGVLPCCSAPSAQKCVHSVSALVLRCVPRYVGQYVYLCVRLCCVVRKIVFLILCEYFSFFLSFRQLSC